MDIRDRIIQFVDYKGISFNFFEKKHWSIKKLYQ